MSDHPNIWTDGGREDFTSVGGFEVAGAGVYLPASEVAFDHSVWGTAEEYGDARLERCRAFLLVPGGRLFNVLMQAYWPCHLGIDNLSVARTIGRLLDKDCLAMPLPLVKDGDLAALVQYMIRSRGRETVRVRSKGMLKMLMFSQVGFGWRISLEMLRLMADAAADSGRRHQSEVLIDARRRLLKARGSWYPLMPDLHRFMIAVARVTVNHGGRGGTAPDPWCGIRVVGGRCAGLTLGLMLILPLSLVLLVSWVGHGFNFMVVVFLVLTLLPDLTVLAFFVKLLPFWDLTLACGYRGYGTFWSFFLRTSYPFRAMGWSSFAQRKGS